MPSQPITYSTTTNKVVMWQVSKEISIALQVEGWDAIQTAINVKEGHICAGIGKSSKGEIEKETSVIPRTIFLKNKCYSASPKKELNKNLSFPATFLLGIIFLTNPFSLIIKP